MTPTPGGGGRAIRGRGPAPRPTLAAALGRVAAAALLLAWARGAWLLFRGIPPASAPARCLLVVGPVGAFLAWAWSAMMAVPRERRR